MIAENTVSHGFETMAFLDGCDTSGLGSGEYSGRYGLEGDCRAKLHLRASGLAGRATEW